MMKLFLPMICVLVLGMYSAQADDISLTDGRVLKNAKVLEADVDFLRISHDDGVAKVYAKDLPEEMKEEWSMTPEKIEKRKEVIRQKEKAIQERNEQKAKELRESLSDSQKIPRYIQPSELFNLFAPAGGIHPVEARYLALKWNEQEAERVGLPDQAKTFAKQMNDLQPKMDKIEEERALALRQWQEVSEQLAQLSENSKSQISSLKNQISQLKSDLNTNQSSNNRTIIYGSPAFWGTYPYSTTIRTIPVPYPVRPVPPAPRPVVKPVRIISDREK